MTDLTELKERLARRISKVDIHKIQQSGQDNFLERVYALISDDDHRISYNALWILTLCNASDRAWLASKRDELIDRVMTCDHVGKIRLMLTLLERTPMTADDVRSDYLDFCLDKIDSTSPPAIRAFCLREAYRHCKFYPEMTGELMCMIEHIEQSELPPAIRSVIRNIRKDIYRRSGS